jgi:hypothetical protein
VSLKPGSPTTATTSPVPTTAGNDGDQATDTGSHTTATPTTPTERPMSIQMRRIAQQRKRDRDTLYRDGTLEPAGLTRNPHVSPATPGETDQAGHP